MQIELAVVFLIIWLLMLWLGAIALEATGMERRKARFQALSALTGTGFTTRESEDVINHPRRRTILSWLIFFGNVGIILFLIFLILFVGASLKSVSLVKVGILIAPIILLLVLIWFGVLDRAGTKIANQWKRLRYFTSELSNTEIIHQAGDYSLARVTVGEKAPEVSSKIGDTSMSQHNIKVLAIERGDKVLPFPQGKETVLAGDQLLCYGETAQISKALHQK